MGSRNARRGQQRRQKAYRDRHGIKMTTMALRPALHVPIAYLKAQHDIPLADIVGMGLRVYKDRGYFDDEALAEFEELRNQFVPGHNDDQDDDHDPDDDNDDGDDNGNDDPEPQQPLSPRKTQTPWER